MLTHHLFSAADPGFLVGGGGVLISDTGAFDEKICKNGRIGSGLGLGGYAWKKFCM